MIELLISLLAMSLCCMLFAQIVHLLYDATITDYHLEDEIAIKQMQLMLAQASDYQIQQESFYFKYHGEDFRLEQYQDQLVKRKGYEVILQDIDAVSFYAEESCILMSYQRNEVSEEVMLACE